ncbi:MAG: cytochrome P450, partial [Gemmatimonadetes bacterium]|nr:cytochrome P450 [Gemmatimonadota bacterium]
AHASHPTPSATHCEAVAALAQALPRDVEPQAFVALTQSLPALLATAWRHLVRDWQSWTDATRTPLTTARVDELLRVGSPVEVLFRTATRDTEVAGTRLPAGAIVAVGIGAAHRDRDAHGAVLTFGRGRHGCPGAGLIRSLLRVATTTLLEAFPQAEPAAGAAYGGGFALRYVTNLPVSVGRPRALTTTCTGR